MKSKTNFLLTVAICFITIFSLTTVKAKENNNVYYTNSNGVEFTKYEYGLSQPGGGTHH